MTVQQLIDVLQANGWRETKNDTRLRCLQHESSRKIITIAGNLELNVPPAVLRAVLRYAQLQE